MTDPTDTVPWVEKYRPQTLSDLVAHEDVIETIQKFITADRLPHLLFHGPAGTGKTSTIQSVARQMYGRHARQMLLELNASDDRGIGVVRDTIRTFAESRATSGAFGADRATADDMDDEKPRGVKLIVLDEADAMTAAAQMALRRIMENYAEHIRFCIVCNIVNKINPALQSRCTKFRFPPLPAAAVATNIGRVTAAEGLEVTPGGVAALTKIGQGDMRRVLNTMQCVTMSAPGAPIDEDAVYRCLGSPIPKEIDFIVEVLMDGKSFKETHDQIEELLLTKGYSLQDVLQGVYEKAKRFEWLPSTPLILQPRLADIEYRLARGADEKIQLAALVSAFVEARMDITDFRKHMQ